MPGIYGYLPLQISDSASELPGRMAQSLREQDSDILDVFTSREFTLGSIGLARHKPETQPGWTEQNQLVVGISGEIFGYESRWNELKSKGYALEDKNPLPFILALYLEEGEKFVKSLNGTFCIVIWDQSRRKLILVNDRLGIEPLFYAKTATRILFASGARALMADPELSKEINDLALAQFLTVDHVMGENTFIKNIELLPPASLLTVVEGQISIRSYWRMEFPEQYSCNSEKEYQEELITLLRQAVDRQRPDAPAAIMLSGGLDSRLVLALLIEKTPDNELKAFTFGVPGCDDLQFARELARKLSLPHKYFPLRNDYLIQQAEKGIRITDGMENVVNMHTLDNLKAQAEEVQIFYKGFLGDALTGYFTFQDLFTPYREDCVLDMFLSRYPLIFKPEEHSRLFNANSSHQLTDSVLQSIRSELNHHRHHRQASEAFFEFDIRQRQRRLTVNGVYLMRSQARVRSPFYDNDLVDFFLRIPQGYRLNRHLVVQAFVHAFPELAKIPYTATGYPMMACRRELFMRLDEHIRWKLREVGLKGIKVRQKRNYVNYSAWFRHELRDWASELLLSERTSSRGYFNREYIRQLWSEHLAGQNHAKKLGALISIELWHRQFIDL